MKKLFITLLLVISMAIMALAFLEGSDTGKKTKALPLPAKNVRETSENKPSAKFLQKAGEAKTFARENNYRDDYFFLVDFGLLSNKNRFFIYDLKRDRIVKSGLVTHGNCNQYWLDKVKFNNTVGGG
ncbi:MAG: murein L,D-transpeptidase catalytic domain-containing protein, partial [Flavisolibacter sp.]